MSKYSGKRVDIIGALPNKGSSSHASLMCSLIPLSLWILEFEIDWLVLILASNCIFGLKLKGGVEESWGNAESGSCDDRQREFNTSDGGENTVDVLLCSKSILRFDDLLLDNKTVFAFKKWTTDKSEVVDNTGCKWWVEWY